MAVIPALLLQVDTPEEKLLNMQHQLKE